MSNTTLTNIPSTLEIRVKEPSDGAQVPPSGPGSSDRFNYNVYNTYNIYILAKCQLHNVYSSNLIPYNNKKK